MLYNWVQAAKEAATAIEDAPRVRADVRSFVMTHADHTWSGRAVARVFHGIGDVSNNDSVSLLFYTVHVRGVMIPLK